MSANSIFANYGRTPRRILASSHRKWKSQRLMVGVSPTAMPIPNGYNDRQLPPQFAQVRTAACEAAEGHERCRSLQVSVGICIKFQTYLWLFRDRMQRRVGNLPHHPRKESSRCEWDELLLGSSLNYFPENSSERSIHMAG
jgi:hypothetical protein